MGAAAYRRKKFFLKSQQKRSKAIENASTGKIAYLTFDDGPSQNTELILDLLKAYEIKATFFVNGNHTEFGKRIYKRIVDENHTLANHTYSHDYSYVYSSMENYIKDTEKLNQLLYEATGMIPQLIRFPGGSNNHVSIGYGGTLLMKNLIQWAKEQGYEYYDWNVDSKDTSSKAPSMVMIVEATLEQIKDQQVVNILLHDAAHKTTTVEALPVIIETLIRRGYSFKAITGDSMVIHFK